MRKKVYSTTAEKQKAYRARKKNAGYKRIVMHVPPHIYPFVEGNPGLFISVFTEYALSKGIHIDFNEFEFTDSKDGAKTMLKLVNQYGIKAEITDPDRIKVIEDALAAGHKVIAVRLFPDGRLEPIL